MRKFYYVFEAIELDEWKYCPKCGAEILEVYPGDFVGHITCFGDDDCDVSFGIIYKDGGGK